VKKKINHSAAAFQVRTWTDGAEKKKIKKVESILQFQDKEEKLDELRRGREDPGGLRRKIARGRPSR